MSEVTIKAKAAKLASRKLAQLNTQEKNELLALIAEALFANKQAIIKANSRDLAKGRKAKMSASLLDRLMLDEQRIANLAGSLRELIELPDPSGKVLSETVRPNGLKIKKVSVPMGVIGMIYESRPNVTVDAAALGLKAGSAVVLRGGSDALETNKVLVKVMREAVEQKITPEVIQFISSPEHALVKELLTCREYLDLVIPRGGAGLIQRVVQEATVPVIETGIGICHVYVDKAADLAKAWPIAFNSKVQRPSVCNSMETLLVHQDVAAKFLPKILADYHQSGVLIHGCKRTKQFAKYVRLATAKDFGKEFLGLEIAIKVVDSLDEAIEHVLTNGSRHTESIVTEDSIAADRFLKEIDASTVLVNASTRFTDGGEFGFGCEIGISTQKLHARGPMGLAEMMTYKYLVYGNGQIRS